MKSQKHRILSYLKRGHKLTVLSALHLFGCYALSQRCGELSRAGHPIKSEMIELPNGKRIASYSIQKP